MLSTTVRPLDFANSHVGMPPCQPENGENRATTAPSLWNERALIDARVVVCFIHEATLEPAPPDVIFGRSAAYGRASSVLARPSPRPERDPLTSDEKPSPEEARKVHEHDESVAKADRRGQLRRGKQDGRRFRRSGRSRRSRARQKDWTDEAFRHPDESDHDTLQRIMSRDEHDRRREVEKAVLQTEADRREGGLTGFPDPGVQQGLVTAAGGLHARVLMEGSEVDCTVRGILTEMETGFMNPVAAGDRVLVTGDGAAGWVIDEVLPRQTVLARPDPFLAPRQQVIAANVDLLLIVSAWRNPVIWLELIDRYLVLAQRTGLEPVICINKADLIADETEFETAVRPYLQLDYRVVRTSATDGTGVGELRVLLAGRTTAVVGLSGTGKSSLLSAVQPGLKLRTAEVSEASGQGQHTTSQPTLHSLEAGGYVADTPGIREFGLGGLTRVELQDYFPEVLAQARDCRFSNCSHVIEPACAVQAAEGSGAIAPSRAHSYRSVWRELPDG